MTIQNTHCALIRRNTPELRKKLERLGYKIINEGETTLDAHNYDGRGHHRHIDDGTATITSYGGLYGVIYDIDDVAKRKRIDCDTNEELFLVIAALREDSDKGQWFVDKRGGFVQCRYHKIQEFIDRAEIAGYDIGGDWLHKATVEELVEHFTFDGMPHEVTFYEE